MSTNTFANVMGTSGYAGRGQAPTTSNSQYKSHGQESHNPDYRQHDIHPSNKEHYPATQQSHDNHGAKQFNHYEKVLHNVRYALHNPHASQTQQIKASFETAYPYMCKLVSDVAIDCTRQTAAVYDSHARDKAGPSVEELQEEIKKLKKEKHDQNKILENAASEITHKLASQMSSQVSMDESSFENISIKSRPINIQSEYEALCANEWHIAKEVLDKTQGTKKDKVAFLFSVYKLSLEEAKISLMKVKTQLQDIMTEPIKTSLMKSQGNVGPVKTGASVQMGGSVTNNVIADTLRQGADSADITALVQIITDNLKKSNISYHLMGETEKDVIKNYIKACARLAWKMVLQRPPLIFVDKGVGGRWQEGTQEPFWGSDNGATKVEYYVHPALYQDDKLMVKGKVVLKRN